MSAELRPGAQLGGFRIIELVARGGMGVVYLAEDLRLKRRVAVKVLAPEFAQDEAFRRRFARESELAAAIDHPNIVPIYGAGETTDHLLWIAMRYVEGSNLRELIAKHGRLDLDHALAIVGQIGRALDAAHRRGLVHRDVKPGNILIVPAATDETLDHVYLTDFGLTKRASDDSGLTGSGQFLGTIDFIAPEQIQGRTLDGRADQYSLACVLYTCLSGQAPFLKQTEVATIYAHLTDPPPKLSLERPELPAALDTVLAKSLAKDPDDRYASCAEMLAHVREALSTPLAEKNTAPTDLDATKPAARPEGPTAQPAAKNPAGSPSAGSARQQAPTSPPRAPVTPPPPIVKKQAGPSGPRRRRSRLILSLFGLALIGGLVGAVILLGGRGKPGAARSPTPTPSAPIARDDLFVMNADGSGQIRLTTGPTNNQSPAWSPDGSRIAFVSDRDGSNQIYVMNSNGTGVTQLTKAPGDNSGPAWSHDGRRILFASNRDGNPEVYVMNVDGSAPVNLTKAPTSEFDPAWSLDSRRVAFVSNRDRNNEIYLMSADGSDLRRLTMNPADDRSPQWSPDSKAILFRRGVMGKRDVYIFHLIGKGVRVVDLSKNAADDFAPAWSPDGRRIAFVSNRDGNNEIYVMNADGTAVTRLTMNPGEDGGPIWSPDGKQILFVSART